MTSFAERLRPPSLCFDGVTVPCEDERQSQGIMNRFIPFFSSININNTSETFSLAKIIAVLRFVLASHTGMYSITNATLRNVKDSKRSAFLKASTAAAN